jgi:hypothetical protein
MKQVKREHYISYMTELIPAVRSGLKTETRRIVKGTKYPSEGIGHYLAQIDNTFFGWHVNGSPCVPVSEYPRIKCPYGIPGDILLVKESYALAKEYDHLSSSQCPPEARERIWYLADGEKPDWAGRTRSSRFTPRWAIRTRLIVDEIRVERVQDITEDGAKAEGIRGWTKDGNLYKYGLIEPGDDGSMPWSEMKLSPREAFWHLWDHVNGKNGHEWAKNDWVFVIKFHLIESAKQVA